MAIGFHSESFTLSARPRLHVAAELPDRRLVVRVLASALVPVGDAVALAAALQFVSGPATTRLACGVLAFAALRAERPARLRLSLRVTEQLLSLVGRLAIAFVAVAWFASADASAALLRAAVPALLLVLVFRAVNFAIIRNARVHGVLEERTVIVGSGWVARQCAENLAEHPEHGLVPVGFVDSWFPGAEASLPLPVLGDVRAVEGIVAEFGVRRAVVAFGGHHEYEMVEAMRTFGRLGVAVYVIPRFFELGVCPDGAATDRIWGTRLVYVRPPVPTAAARFAKRALDIAVSSTLLVLASPFLLSAAVAVKLSSPGPVLFRQWRVGRDGRRIRVLKLRSMRVNTDSDTTWSVDEDDRLTAVGRALRKTSIDELPQLFNVLRGDMSMVGPRPERAFFVSRFSTTVDGYDDRHRVSCGLSGWAQVNGLRGDTSIEERVRFDNDYIEHWSLWRDLMIMALTALTIVRDALPSWPRRRRTLP